MKIITIILTTIVLNGCGGSKQAAVTEQDPKASIQTEQAASMKNTQDESLQIEYTAMSRGAYKHLEMIDGNINVIKARGGKAMAVNCEKEQWSKVVSLVKDIKMEELSELETPSNASSYDAALSATLKITKNGKTYQTEAFDHGNPPKKVKPLVDYILSLSKVE